MSKEEKNIKVALKLLDDERLGRVAEALEKLHDQYSMTWVYQSNSGEFFPRHDGKQKDDFDEIYEIQDRQYDIKNVSATGDVVFLELVESYPEAGETGRRYNTPEVIVLEFKDGKVRKGRHYCDPKVSYACLSNEQVSQIFQ